MFGSHGHSHDGGACNHSHGSSRNMGFGDDDDAQSPQQKAMMNPMMNPTMMAMMQQHMKNNPQANEALMAMTQAQNNPQMKELMGKMFQQRQQMMKEFMEKGGQSNPDAMKELMEKSAEAQAKFMTEIKALNLSNQNASKTENFIPNTLQNSNSENNKASDLLGGNLNNSSLDDLINKRSGIKKQKEEQEAKIMEAINRKDYSDLNAVKATQYGVLDRLKELIESGQVNPNQPDSENVYLLHWAAINNRIEIANYLLGLGVEIDSIGGELETTPLNWAARSGHVQMCILLMQHGANPNLYDVEGFSTIHVATMFGHSNVVAYLLVKGIDVRNIFIVDVYLN